MMICGRTAGCRSIGGRTTDDTVDSSRTDSNMARSNAAGSGTTTKGMTAARTISSGTTGNMADKGQPTAGQLVASCQQGNRYEPHLMIVLAGTAMLAVGWECD